MTIFEMAQKYYPKLWSKERIDALHDAGKLTDEEYNSVVEGLAEETETQAER